MPSPRVLLTLSTDQAAWIVAVSSDRAVLETPGAYPHGSTVIASIADTSHALRLKVFRCKKAGEVFLVEGRLEGATRALRTFLTESLTSADDVS